MKHPDDNQTIDMIEETTRRGRKPLAAAEPATEVVDSKLLAAPSQAATDLAVIQSAMTDDQVRFSQRIGERIGRQHAASLLQKVVTVTDLIELQEFKDSKAYRGMRLQDASGKVVTVTTWAEFCVTVEGRAVESVDRDLLNLRKLGSDLFSSMQRIGLGPAKMRELRQIPEAERVEMLEQTGGKELSEEVIADLLDKHKKQLADKDKQIQAVEKKKTEAEQSAEAARRVAADKNTVIDHLREKLERPYTPSKHASARNEREKAAIGVIQAAATKMNSALLDAAQVLNDLSEQDGISQSCHDAARNDLVWVAHRLAAVMREHGIELDLAAEIVPSWVREVEATTAEKQKGG